jgi:serine/threonine protein kinase
LCARPLFSGFEEELLGSYAFDILRALTHLHDAGVTHRNISSANVLLDPQVPLYRCTPTSHTLH